MGRLGRFGGSDDARPSGDAVYDLIRTSPSEYWESGLRPYEPWLAAGNLVLTTAIIVVLAVSHRQFYARVQRASLPKA